MNSFLSSVRSSAVEVLGPLQLILKLVDPMIHLTHDICDIQSVADKMRPQNCFALLTLLVVQSSYAGCQMKAKV